MRKGFTLIELLIVIAIIAILAAIAVPNFLEAQIRAKVSRVRADQRSLATGLEAYYVDQNSYPAWASKSGTNKWGTGGDPNIGHVNAFSGQGTGAASIHSFRVRTALPGGSTGRMDQLFFMLTTPISYVSSLFVDPFASSPGAIYGYYGPRGGWILVSFGPDTDEPPNDAGNSGDIDRALEAHMTGLGPWVQNVVTGNNETLYDPNRSAPSLTLICGDYKSGKTGAFTYDPTNGTTSEGDIYRTKQ